MWQKKANPKHQDEKQSPVYSYEEGLTIVSQISTLMTKWIEWMSKIASPQLCENEGQMSQNSLGSTLCIPPNGTIISIRCKYSETCCFISSEANLRVAET